MKKMILGLVIGVPLVISLLVSKDFMSAEEAICQGTGTGTVNSFITAVYLGKEKLTKKNALSYLKHVCKRECKSKKLYNYCFQAGLNQLKRKVKHYDK